ncbi:hypothetical protein HY838_01930 [Candidatus Azambacteria bacterium]|nr:hypothetical protein [Candidatus Azambacteria bacterium]
MNRAALKIQAFENLKLESLNTIFGLSVIGLAVFYLFAINSVVVANYQKTVLQKTVDNLKIEIRSLNLNLSEKRSIGFLEKAAKNMNLVANDKIQYVQVSGSVAKSQ